MTPSEFVEYQRQSDTCSAIPETDFDKSDMYDVLYRSLACIFSPFCLGLKMSLEGTRKFLKDAHPYFVHIFAKPEGEKMLVDLYEFFDNAWGE